MNRSSNKKSRIFLTVLAAFSCIFAFSDVSFANSLGVGGREQAITPTGPFADILFWIQQQQKAFYKSMTVALKEIKSGEQTGLWLVALSLAYGVLHAAGPGHGKAVISMYMIANEVQLKRGIMLSFASAILQALVAIACIFALVLVLRGIGYRSNDMTRYLEISSYAAITLLGLWLLWRKLFAGNSHTTHQHEPSSHAHVHDHSHDEHYHNHHHHDHVCHAGCSHAHMPDPQQLTGNFDLKSASAAVLAVGIRPCTGALIVLTFAFLNGLHAYGVASAFAMALGTGFTVSILASLAVYAKNFTNRISSSPANSQKIFNIIEILGALFIFLIGLLLLMASMNG